ncbi:calcium-binding protein [Inquilinus limosus]|uniref:calcium-binding protein n=1 Tax=Inquilinus limosus TaxID=171674 RepID=UPI000412C995|nr:calcium-binding protein [Inquilinus limosus]
MPVFSGTAAADRIVGSAEADQLYGLAGDDKLYGAAGNDWLIGGLGADILVGGLGDDSYDVDSAGDQVVERAGEGTDRVRAWISHQLAANVEILTLAGTADLIGTGNALDNTIVGNAGNNVLNGSAGNDVLIGGKGDDVYDVDSAGDKVAEAAGEGQDRVRSLVSWQLGANVEDLTLGGTGDLMGTGNALANTLIGNAGNNVLNGSLGDDLLIGRAGNDVYDVDSIGDKVQESAGEGYDRVRSSVSYTLGAHVEELNLTGAVAIDGTGNGLANTIVGNGAGNAIAGGAGDDVVYGMDGNDRLSGDAGFDRVYGGSGNDNLDIRSADIQSGEVYDGGSGVDTFSVKDFGDADLFKINIINIENLDARNVNLYSNQLNSFKYISAWEIRVIDGGEINLENSQIAAGTSIKLSDFGNVINLGSAGAGVVGENGDDTVTGGRSAIGNGGDDTLVAGAHGATLNGGVGDDILRGGIGSDLIYDGAGSDDVNGGDGNDYLHVNDGYIAAGDRYEGGAGVDELSVGYEDYTPSVDISIAEVVSFEVLTSFTSRLILRADQLDGFRSISAPRIEIVGGGSVDLTDSSFVASNMTLFLSATGNTIRAGSWGFEVQGGDGADTVIGGSRRDFYAGGAGNDLLDGRGDDDSLFGFAGDDTLTGGAGHDSLSGGDGNDIIIGGADGDSIHGGIGRDRFVFTSTLDGGDFINDFNPGQGDTLVFQGLLHGTFSYLGAAAFTASGNSEARFASGQVLVDTDGNGTADITINLTGFTSASQLHTSDFVFS